MPNAKLDTSRRDEYLYDYVSRKLVDFHADKTFKPRVFLKKNELPEQAPKDPEFEELKNYPRQLLEKVLSIN